jgi:(+)-neomenthol dehydrogenase
LLLVLYFGRVAVVTGGNRGIGLEVCRQLASNGVAVVLTALDEKMGEEAVERLQGLALSHVLSHQLDITDASSIARLADFLKTRFGKLDILVITNQSRDLVFPTSPKLHIYGCC